ncbi:MAG: ABC transporter permease [Treponema sp.]|nr:ABC transporter permease [Treponema sp.]
MNGELRLGIVLLVPILLMPFASLFGPDHNRMEAADRFLPPGIERPAGTDNFGRDVLARVLAGSRQTLVLALLVVTSSLALGTALGLVAGYLGGIADELVMRVMDAVSSFPGILFALVMVALLGNGQGTLLLALAVLFVPSFTRLARGGTLACRDADFVLAEKLLGCGLPRILFVHVLPNLKGSLLPAAAIGLSNAILAESAMSYLGLGIQPPEPSWGRMLAEAQIFLYDAPWCALAPGLAVMLTAVGFHCLGNGLRRKFGG